jgi:Arc/MetJ-type ribon-helix-helix transcriptional regulator
MIRSTRAQKAERLKAARRLLADEIGMAEAAMALSRTFGLSRRQAYRYLELARAGAPAPSAAKNSITITLKMPESLAHALRAHATERSVTTSEVVRQAVAAFLAAKRRHG